jgi:protein AroM
LGQSPRPDITVALARMLGSAFELIEGGATDGLGRAEVEALAPGEAEEAVISRQADGAIVVVGVDQVLPHLQAAVDRTAETADVAAVLCSGGFDGLRAPPCGLVEIDAVVQAHLASRAGDVRTLGVVVPLAEQVRGARAAYAEHGWRVEVAVGSPYESLDRYAVAVADVDARGAELVLLDCMGCSDRHHRCAEEHTRAEVVTPVGLLAQALRAAA